MNTSAFYTTWNIRRQFCNYDSHKNVLYTELVNLLRENMASFSESMLRACSTANTESELCIPIRIATDYVTPDRMVSWKTPNSISVTDLLTTTDVLYRVTREIFGIANYMLVYDAFDWIRLRYYPNGLPPYEGEKLDMTRDTPELFLPTPVQSIRYMTNVPPVIQNRPGVVYGLSSPTRRRLSFDEV